MSVQQTTTIINPYKCYKAWSCVILINLQLVK